MRSRTIGMSAPKPPATSKLMIIAEPMITASIKLSNHTQVTSPITSAKISPLSSPTTISLVRKRCAAAPTSFFIAMARTATESDWVPAFPPIEATIGISTASATTRSRVSVNNPITSDANTAVKRFTNSQIERDFTVARAAE